MSLSFTQNCALVTGASSGIGEALARALADRGTALILTARRQQRLDELAETLSKQVPVSVIPADLSCESGVTDLIDALVARSETIDILVNCAGVALTGWFQEDEQGEQALMYLNMSAPVRLMQHCLPAMKRQGSGRILNVCSVAAFQPVPKMAQYAASKAYLLSLTEAISEELKGSGVFATALCPGVTATESVIPEVVEVLPEVLVQTPEAVANEGLDAMARGDAVCIPGRLNQAAVTLSQFQPRRWIRRLGGLAARLS
jgi:short-subunit dehydrogenase